MIKLNIEGKNNLGSSLLISENKGRITMNNTKVNNINVNTTVDFEKRLNDMSERGAVNMSMHGNNALKIEKKEKERKGGFKLKINKFDIYFEVKKNEERELELAEKRVRNAQNLKRVNEDREKQAVRFLGDL